LFGKKITLFKIAGFTVSIDLSWFLIFGLVTWSLATGVFPPRFGNLPKYIYWIMGISGAFGLFLSVVLHELMHSLIARRYGVPMKGITLFIFGGVAEMEDEPPSPNAEFTMAIAGPITSGIIALISFGISMAIKGTSIPVSVYGVFRYLAFINLALAAFNLVPAFPLDGGRVLRSAIWKSSKNLKRSTLITSRIGMGFGFLLIGFGLLTFILRNFVGGMWWFLIGLFLINAARSSYRQLLFRRVLEGEKVSRFMNTDTVTVPPHISLYELVEGYIYKFHYKMFPVVENGKLTGCISTKQLNDIPKSEWKDHTVEEIANHCSEDNSVSPDTDAVKVLGKMHRTGMSRIMVVEGGRLLGVVSLKDLLKFISIRIELEE
jgi:Zn-dependent protease/predicted transcriptional regulator